ncbi:MAG TPA: hypothetical protein VFK69_04495 [Candidatus Eisenbacteria bacterium]|nr:hypothetical protein [Candidatus Eisenbacteria bacterium]
MSRVVLAALAVLAFAAPAEAKKFRYTAGPKPAQDTTYTSAEPDLEPIVRPRGPRVPVTNLQMIELVANTAFHRALAQAPIDKGAHVVLAPAESHPLNFVVEHALLRALAEKGVTTTVRRSLIPDDSLATFADPTDPVLEYQLATARVSYLRLVGWLPFSGRVKIERQALVEGGLTLRDPRTARVLWVGDASWNLVDAFPRDRVSLVEDARFGELKDAVPTRNVDKVFEPVLVVAVVAGLVALFFQNRP